MKISHAAKQSKLMCNMCNYANNKGTITQTPRESLPEWFMQI